MEPPEEQERAGQQYALTMPTEHMAGVWANFAQVSHSPYEFTLDFVRLDFQQKKGIVVARVSVSPLFITQLIDALKANWEKYAERALPKEVRDDQ